MHRRKKFPRIKSVFFHLLLLCTKFQSPRSNNELFFFLLVGPLNAHPNEGRQSYSWNFLIASSSDIVRRSPIVANFYAQNSDRKYL